MNTDNIQYRGIVARLALLGLTKKELADRLGISYGTLHNKLCHVTPFTLDECLQIKQILGLPEIESAFKRFDEIKRT